MLDLLCFHVLSFSLRGILQGISGWLVSTVFSRILGAERRRRKEIKGTRAGKGTGCMKSAGNLHESTQLNNCVDSCRFV